MAFFNKFKQMFTKEKEQTQLADEQPITDQLAEQATTSTLQETENPDSINYYHKNMTKSRSQIMGAFTQIMSSFNTVNEEYFEELEDALIMADVGLATVVELVEKLKQQAKLENITDPAKLNEIIVEQLHAIYLESITEKSFNIQYNEVANEPTVILFIGVNGAGKTTTIGKLAYRLKQEGKKVLLAAGDTFRAGAIDQLNQWAQRADVDIVLGQEGKDPSGVMFDAVKQAKAGQYDVLLCDTAGRLQNKVNLMKELEKLYRVIQKELPTAPHETLLVIDSTTGQNGLIQAKSFTDVAPLTGVILSKLDGSAKGGIALAIAKELQIPVKFIGLGEKITDLSPFILENYLYGLFADLFDE